MAHYLFGFSGRINRAKMWLFFLLVVAYVIAATCAVIFTVGLQAIANVAQDGADPMTLFKNPMLPSVFGVIGLLDLVLFIASLAVTTKRLHDRNKSAWWLLVFIALPLALQIFRAGTMIAGLHGGHTIHAMNNPAGTLAGGGALIINLWAFVELYCLRGTEGDNRYGPDPLTSR